MGPAMATTFDITTPAEFLNNLLVPQHQDFIANNSSRRHALLTTIVAYHMYEWVHRRKFTICEFETLYPANSTLAETFELARNIANGTKHFADKARTRAQKGFSSAFSDDFARPLVVVFPDGTERSVDLFLRDLVTFWTAQHEAGAF